MNAEEAVAGLVLCACELLRSARGGSDTGLPLSTLAETTRCVDSMENTGFSEERFSELGGGAKTASAGSESPDGAGTGEIRAAETDGFSEILLEAVKTFENSGFAFSSAREDGSADAAAWAVKRFSSPGFPAANSFSRALSRREIAKEGGGDAAFDAERFSEYLERDGRRYDSGFEFY